MGEALFLLRVEDEARHESLPTSSASDDAVDDRSAEGEWRAWDVLR
jgi:hypothetical protein